MKKYSKGLLTIILIFICSICVCFSVAAADDSDVVVLRKISNGEILDAVLYATSETTEWKKDLQKELKGYGELSIRDERVVPCCAPNYIHIAFNISISN